MRGFEEEVLGLEVSMTDVVLVVDVLDRPTWSEEREVEGFESLHPVWRYDASGIMRWIGCRSASPQDHVHDLCRVLLAEASFLRLRLCDYAVEQFASRAQLRDLKPTSRRNPVDYIPSFFPQSIVLSARHFEVAQ